VSAIFPARERAQIAHILGLEVLPKEEHCPMIVHHKLSCLMALEIFGVTDPFVLDAIGCHTTLRAQATPPRQSPLRRRQTGLGPSQHFSLCEGAPDSPRTVSGPRDHLLRQLSLGSPQLSPGNSPPSFRQHIKICVEGTKGRHAPDSLPPNKDQPPSHPVLLAGR
jgi:hypothetical protein